MERIFLLEDDEALGRGVAMALAGPDREVSRAASLAEAKAALAGQRFSLLVLDVNLPDGSALDLVRGLRAAGDETPVAGGGGRNAGHPAHRQRPGTGRGDRP